MKANKYLVSLLTAVTITISSLPVYASSYEVPGTEATDGTTRDTAVTYNQEGWDADYTVTIPKAVQLGSAKTATYSITVKGAVETGLQVNVKPHDSDTTTDGINFLMSETSGLNKSDVVVTVSQDSTAWGSDEITEAGVEKSGTIDGSNLSRGEWTGTLTFDIDLENVSAVMPTEP